MSDLNAIGVLKRREIEARILVPFVDALAADFGRDRVVEMGPGEMCVVPRGIEHRTGATDNQSRCSASLNYCVNLSRLCCRKSGAVEGDIRVCHLVIR